MTCWQRAELAKGPIIPQNRPDGVGIFGGVAPSAAPAYGTGAILVVPAAPRGSMRRMDNDDTLTINPEFLRALILKLRAVMAQEELVSPDSGSNPSDDEGPATLQDSPDNLTADEIVAQIEDLEPDQQAELVALMWIGRGDFEADEWTEAVALAIDRRDRPTSAYLLSHPQVAEDMIEGVDKIFDGSDLLETGEY